MNGFIDAATSDSLSILILLDLNAAFDTVDYSILLDHFGCYGSLAESVLSGFHSCVLNQQSPRPKRGSFLLLHRRGTWALS